VSILGEEEKVGLFIDVIAILMRSFILRELRKLINLLGKSGNSKIP
jgi:hypothetical protein